MKFIWKVLIWQRRQKATLTLYQQLSFIIILSLFCFYTAVNFCVWRRIDEEFGKFRHSSSDEEISHGWITIWPARPHALLVIILGNNSRMRTTRDGVSMEGKSEEKEKVYQLSYVGSCTKFISKTAENNWGNNMTRLAPRAWSRRKPQWKLTSAGPKRLTGADPKRPPSGPALSRLCSKNLKEKRKE